MDTFLKVHTIFQTSVHTCVHLSIPNFARSQWPKDDTDWMVNTLYYIIIIHLS